MKRSFSEKVCFCPICYHLCGCDDIELESKEALPRGAKFSSDKYNNVIDGKTLCE